MRVPEAKEKILELFETEWSRYLSEVQKDLERVLDDVWLTAYEEGKAMAFEPPEEEPPIEEYDPGPEVDAEGGMTVDLPNLYRYYHLEPQFPDEWGEHNR